MAEFLTSLVEHEFLRNALLAGLLASVACGVVGTYVVVRRIALIAGGISHCVLGGIGAAYYLREAQGWPWLDPLYGAIVAALLAALVIGLVTRQVRERADTVIAAMWAVGMAAGVLFLAATPGYKQDLMSYLFGNILLVSRSDLWLIGALDAVILVLVVLFANPLMAICFDEEQARLRGVHTGAMHLLLLVLTALTVVLLVTVVGIVMVIALLTLPVAVAGHFTRRLGRMMLLSALISAAFTTTGLAVSYEPDLPAGATIIILAGAVYLLVMVGHRLLKRR